MALLWKRFLYHPRNSFCTCQIFGNSLRQFCSDVSSSFASAPIKSEISEEFFLEPAVEKLMRESKKEISVIEELPELEDVSYIGPPISYKSFNFAAYANDSIVLQKLIDLGVDFYYIERNFKNLPSYLLQLDFVKHIQPHIQFLLDQNVPLDKLGLFFSKNPFFFQIDLSDLQVRINYLQWKRFTSEMIRNMLIKNPRLLNYPTVIVDSKLGFFQKQFGLKGFEVRQLISSYPVLISIPYQQLTPIIFDLKEVVPFTEEQAKEIILKQPYIFRIKREELKKRLDYMIVDMELPLSFIAADPSGLVNRLNRLRERHLFLKSLGKAQYDPKKPNYVSITDITHGDDATFCERTAKTSVETFNLFLKSL